MAEMIRDLSKIKAGTWLQFDDVNSSWRGVLVYRQAARRKRDNWYIIARESSSKRWYLGEVRHANHYLITLTKRPPAKMKHAVRSDGYHHVAILAGRRLAILAGCRRFNSLAAARKHWTERDRHPWTQATLADPYASKAEKANARKRLAIDKALNKWSLAFVAAVARWR